MYSVGPGQNYISHLSQLQCFKTSEAAKTGGPSSVPVPTCVDTHWKYHTSNQVSCLCSRERRGRLDPLEATSLHKTNMPTSKVLGINIRHREIEGRYLRLSHIACREQKVPWKKKWALAVRSYVYKSWCMANSREKYLMDYIIRKVRCCSRSVSSTVLVYLISSNVSLCQSISLALITTV
jgi:hypothetical protein